VADEPSFKSILHRRRRIAFQGERRLMLAVLKDAVENYATNLNTASRRGQERFREAEEWIDRPQNPHDVFGFDNVCEALDIDPDYLRGGLHRWKEKHLHARGDPELS
jgi:hypothetical protein